MSFSLRSRVEFIGNDPQIASLLETANRAATSDATVLIHETRTARAVSNSFPNPVRKDVQERLSKETQPGIDGS